MLISPVIVCSSPFSSPATFAHLVKRWKTEAFRALSIITTIRTMKQEKILKLAQVDSGVLKKSKPYQRSVFKHGHQWWWRTTNCRRGLGMEQSRRRTKAMMSAMKKPWTSSLMQNSSMGKRKRKLAKFGEGLVEKGIGVRYVFFYFFSTSLI